MQRWRSARGDEISGDEARFDLDAQLYVHLEAELLAEADAEILAVDLRRRVGAADVLAAHVLAQEALDLERHGLRHTVQRERAFDLGGRAVLEVDELARVLRGRKLPDVEHVLALVG